MSFFAGSVANANGTTFSGAVTDPTDAPLIENVDGSSYREPDVQGVGVSYEDEQGTLQVIIRFLDPLPETTGPIVVRVAPECDEDDKGEATITLAAGASTDGDSATLLGYQGQLTPAKAFSPDRRVLTARVAAPSLVDQSYRCVSSIVLDSDETEPFVLYTPGALDATPAAREPSLRVPRLSIREAKYYLRVALGRRFEGSYKHAYGRRMKGCDRRSRTRVRCRHISWIIGDVSFVGQGTVWYAKRGGQIDWNYAWKITMFDEYCLDVTPHRDCTTTYRVH